MQIKFITLNVWIGGQMFDDIVAFLKHEQPDILAIQEAYNETDSHLEKRYHTISEFKKLLDLPYSVFSPTFIVQEENGLQVEQGNAVFSKFPLKLKDVIFYDQKYRLVHANKRSEWPVYPRILQHVTIEIPTQVTHPYPSQEGTNTKHKLNVFNTHGIWGEDGEDNPRRLEMSQTIIENVRNKPRTILSGDFNVNEHTQSIKNIGKVLNDVFAGELTTSFNMKQKPKDSGYGKAVVDHIFASNDIKVLNHYMPDANISDHMPLVTNMEIAD